MADHSTAKKRSVLQEDYIAREFNGVRSRSSGAAAHDQGDVRNDLDLIECKHRGSPAKAAQSISIKVSDLGKIIEEAYSEGRDPKLALTIYTDHPLGRWRDGAKVFDLIVEVM